MQRVNCHETSAGRCIYSFQVEAFPTLVANIYLVDDGDRLILIDTGSGLEQSNEEFLAGFAALRARYGVSFSPTDLDLILITHAHMDHFGGLPFVRTLTDAPIGAHILDRRVLSHYEERIVVATKRLETFLERAGVGDTHRQTLMRIYLFAKGIYRSTPVDFLLEDGEPVAGIIPHHVPGHCPGQVCLQVDDILLTADHVLSRTTPHQAPEAITLNTGLGHYLASLEKIGQVEGIALALGGHEAPMPDLQGRIRAIQALHEARLQRVLELCAEPASVADVSRALFGEVDSYHVLLALEEAGAHVEYLYQRGELVAVNLDEIEQERNPTILYRRT
ncbi:MAG: MBL fold metallo-hydrolase [Candidatus Promineifilaceae bacterium]|nr:MBL fold metallo-hydrolase [Candidatus Promineifilaceae bacterium]